MSNNDIKEIVIRIYNDKSLEKWVKEGIKIYPSQINELFPYLLVPPYKNLSLTEPINLKKFYESIKKEYDYNCQFFLDHFNNINDILVDMTKVYGLGNITCEELIKSSLRTFSLYSKTAKELLHKFKELEPTSNLQRFINAQDYGGIYDNTSTYAKALEEIKNGCKESHWIWYIFPQMKGLGHSKLSNYYGIKDRQEAYAYMENPILSSRLIEATEAVLNNKHTAYEIFGSDTIKFRSCMLLFSTISDNPVFKQVIQKYHW